MSYAPPAAAIATRRDGNPFSLELAQAGKDHADQGGDVAVPEAVQRVHAARIDRLSADQKAAIQLAAVLGREFELDVIDEVWDGSASLEPRLLELKAMAFLRERHGAFERTFVFKHALTRDVAYEGMLKSRRRELHGGAGPSSRSQPPASASSNLKARMHMLCAGAEDAAHRYPEALAGCDLAGPAAYRPDP